MKKVNLEKEEIDIIRKVITNIFKECDIYLFGSRLKRKGGDVDIFVIPKNRDSLYEKRIKAKILLEDMLMRKIDIVIHKDFELDIEKEAIKGIKLK